MPECTACSSTATSTTQSTRPRSDVVRPGTPIAQLEESATTMTSAREQVLVGVQERGERRRADLLLALDEHRDAHAQLVAEHAQGAHVRDHARPCRPRRRARRGVRRARSARTAGCPSRRRRRAAGRRGARTAARSAHPPAPGGGRRPRARPTGDATGPARRRGRRRAAAPTTASALAATCAWSNSALDTLGMRTRASRSARSAPNAAAVRARSASVRSVGEDGRGVGGVGHGPARYSTTLTGCSDAATTPSP